MKKAVILLLVLISTVSIFAGVGNWLKKNSFAEVGMMVEYIPVGKDLYNKDSLKDISSYRFGISASGGIKYAFIENRISCDRIKTNLIHFTDRVSFNLAIPIPYLTIYAGLGLNLTLGQSYENGPFYLGIDDVRIRNIPALVSADTLENLFLSSFYNFGVKAKLPKNINITTTYSLLTYDFRNNCTSYSELLAVMSMGQMSMAVTYSFH